MKPSLSNDARDKLLAALDWPYGRYKRSANYEKAPMYFDACLAWHEKLSADDKETVLTLADVMPSAAALWALAITNLSVVGCVLGEDAMVRLAT